MRSKIIVSAVTFMALAAAAPAFADDKAPDRHPSFPMPAATFKQHIDAKQAKMREHAEKRIAQLLNNEPLLGQIANQALADDKGEE